MKVFKSIHKDRSVSYHTDVKKAIKTNPQIILQEKGLIIKR